MASSYIQYATNNLHDILNDPNGARCIFCFNYPIITINSETTDVSTVICPLCRIDAVVPASIVTSESLILEWHRNGFGETFINNYNCVQHKNDYDYINNNNNNYFYDVLPIDIQNYIFMINNAETNIWYYINRSLKIKKIKKIISPFVSNYIEFDNFSMNNWDNYRESIKYLYRTDFINAIIDSYHCDYKYNDVNFWHKLLSVIYKLIFYSKYTDFYYHVPDYKKKNKLLNKFVLLLCKKYNFKLCIFMKNKNDIYNSSMMDIYATSVIKPISFEKLLGFVKIYKPYKKKEYFNNQLWN